MKFHAVLLYINDQFPDISIFKNLQEVGQGLYPKGAYLYSVEQEFITDRFYWMYFQYDNAKLYSDKVIDIEDNSVKENPRPKSQVEPRLQLFSCYDLESHILYVSDYSKKATITDYISEMLQKSAQTKNVLRSVDDFLNVVTQLKSVCFTQRRTLFTSKEDSIFKKQANLYGLDLPEKSKIRLDYGATREWFCGCKRNPIFTHRNLGRDYPVIYAGHGDLVDDADGNWYVVMLASRPCEGHCSIGRETFLAKVEWEDGWPVINPGIGHLTEKTELPIGEYRLEKEVTHADFITFDQKKIDDRLLSLQRRDENTYSLIERKGFLRMYLKKQKLTEKTDAQYFGLRQKDYDFTFSACMEFDAERENEQAGIVCYQNHANHLSMRICGGKEKRKLQVIAHITENDTLLAEEEINAKGMLELYLKAAGQRAEFFVRDEEGKVLKLIKDVSLLPYSTEEAGGFVGCTLGVYASSNGEMSDRFADVAWISYEGIPG